jgi:ribose transport system ATP-binding protein
VTASAQTAVLAEITDVDKTYGAVRALRGVSFRLGAGEVVGLIGANGAGKSTLVKVLAGVVSADRGSVEIAGSVVRTRRAALDQRVAVVPQELQLVGNESVAHNVFLGRLPRRAGLIDERRLMRDCAAMLERVGLAGIDPRRPAGELTPVQQRLLSIAQGLSMVPSILILDEPTAALPADTALLMGPTIEGITKTGAGVVYISHRLKEVEHLTDRVVAMRDGQVTGELVGDERTVANMVDLVGGRAVIDRGASDEERRAAGERDAVVLRATGLYGKRIRDVDLTLNAGELVGIGGLYGSGRSELLRLLGGHQRPTAGTVEVLGKRGVRSPRAAAKLGIGYVAEERRRMIFPTMDLVANTTIASLDALSRRGIGTNRKLERSAFDEMARRTGLVGGAESAIKTLSGGNQQKVCVSRWLVRKPRVLLLDEPTVGVDVHARGELHNLLRSLAAEGTAVLVACAEPEELVGLCDRVLILVEGELVNELTAPFAAEAVVAASYREKLADARVELGL